MLLSSGVIGLMPVLKFFNEQAFLPSVPLIALKAFQATQTTFEDQAAWDIVGFENTNFSTLWH